MGFFYDDQMNNDDYTVRLYKGAPTYDETPENLVAKSIFSDNFEFEIGNTWTNFEGGNFIEDLFNSIKPYAGYAKGLDDMFKSMKKSGKFNGGSNSVSRGLNGIMSSIADNGVSNYLNKSLVVQGTRFIYFGGSNIDMGSLMMKFTIMHDPILGTVKDQLSKLLPFCIGKFQSAGSGDDGDLLSLIGWQDPPGGFKADWKYVDRSITGTLMLRFGKMFKIDNLVVKSCSVSMSKVRVKSDEYSFIPLYADVALTFQLGGYITRKSITKYTGIQFNDDY